MGKYLDMIGQHEGALPIETVKAAEVAKQQKALDPVPTIQPGDWIIWQLGTGGKVKEAVVDFLQTYPGEAWAFCTLPDGEGPAVNVKYIRKVEASL